jgi:hypothetical protein
VTADAPIKGVEVPGLRSVEIRGNEAKVVVARWTGTLSVDATLEGGKHASAIVTADGSHEAHVTVAPATKPTAKPIPHPTGTATELQSNPYGTP